MKAIWIGGCPRSGTTLLGSLLGSHGDVVTVPEAQFKIEVFRRLGCSGGDLDLEAAFAVIAGHWRFRLWGLSVDRDEIFRARSIHSYSALIDDLVDRYARQHERPGARYWVDHTPSNVRYAKTLFDLFPDSRLIHLVRDGRGVAASIIPLEWGPNTVFEAAKHWVEHLGCGLAAEATFGGERVLRVRYEDLLADPESVLRCICGFAGLDFQPSMVAGGSFAVPAYTRHQHALVGAGPDGRRAERWRSALSARQIEIFEALTGEVLTYLGYPQEFGVGARLPTPFEQLRMKVEEFLDYYLLNSIRHRVRRWWHTSR